MSTTPLSRSSAPSVRAAQASNNQARVAIGTYPTMQAAYAAIQSIEQAYQRTNRKKMTIDLTIWNQSQPFLDPDRRVRMGRETIGINAVYDRTSGGQLDEIAWILTQIDSGGAPV